MSTTPSNEFPCRDCGVDVAWRTSKKGNRYLAQRKEWTVDDFQHGSASRHYWPAHECTPNDEWRERAALAESTRIADAVTAGRVERGVTVEVVKGRKFPIGLRGVVFWVAPQPDAYEVVKVGMTSTAGDKVFIDIRNVRVAQ